MTAWKKSVAVAMALATTVAICLAIKTTPGASAAARPQIDHSPAPTVTQ